MNKHTSKIAVLTCLVLLVIGCTKEPEPLKSAAKVADFSPVAAPALLATVTEQGDPKIGLTLFEFSKLGGGVLYVSEQAGQFRVVHNGMAGKAYSQIANVTLSPDGRRTAYSALVGGTWRLVVDGIEGQAVEESVVPEFSPDSRHITYQARIGGQWHLILDGTNVFTAQKTISRYDFNIDLKKVVYVETSAASDKLRLIVSDLKLKKQKVVEDCGDLMITSDDKSRIAAIKQYNTKQRVIELSFTQPDALKEGQLYDEISELMVSEDGTAVAYIAKKDGSRVVVYNGREEAFPEGMLRGGFMFRPDRKGVGFVMAAEKGFYVQQAFSQQGARERFYDEIVDLTYNKDGSLLAYGARKGKDTFVVVSGKDGPRFDMVVMPQFSPDGRFLVYRARKNGKRFVVVADANGTVIKQHEPYEQVFQPVFTGNGTSIAYGVKDGNKLMWKVEKL